MTTKAVEKRPHVGLFVTCLVDFFRPSVGFAAIKLLEDAGARVEFPERQTCCGQPAYNSGDREDAKAIARDLKSDGEVFGEKLEKALGDELKKTAALQDSLRKAERDATEAPLDDKQS